MIILILSPQFLTADSENPPRLSSATFKQCTPSTEICGSGVDENCDGVDALCPGTDKDRDGFPDHLDCDDSDKFVYPGISVSCSAACGTGTKKCNANGSYSACSCQALCEATGSGKCYYVDPVNGNDANTGTFQSRWKSLARIATYYSGTAAPANKVDLKPGDIVYMFSGLFNKPYNSEGTSHILKLINVKGNANNWIWFKAYPGEKPIITQTSTARGFSLYSVSHIGFEGLTIQNTYGWGIGAFDSDNLEIRNVTVRDTDGLDNDNIAGIYSAVSRDIYIHHSLIHDNYDRLNHDTGGEKTENSRNLVFFSGGNVKVSYSTVYHSQGINSQKTGSCLVYKHGQSFDGFFEVDNSIFRNCFFAAIGTGGRNGNFHHNLILNSDSAFSLKDHGGHIQIVNNIIQYNTIVNTRGLLFNPSEVMYANAPLGELVFRKNIISDSNSQYSPDNGGIFSIDVYGPNNAHDKVLSDNILKSNNNCFFNSSGPVLFNFFASNDVASRSKGGLYSFQQWKNLGYDLSSVSTNPNLDANFISQNHLCIDKGHSAVGN